MKQICPFYDSFLKKYKGKIKRPAFYFGQDMKILAPEPLVKDWEEKIEQLKGKRLNSACTINFMTNSFLYSKTRPGISSSPSIISVFLTFPDGFVVLHQNKFEILLTRVFVVSISSQKSGFTYFKNLSSLFAAYFLVLIIQKNLLCYKLINSNFCAPPVISFFC